MELQCATTALVRRNTRMPPRGWTKGYCPQRPNSHPREQPAQESGQRNARRQRHQVTAPQLLPPPPCPSQVLRAHSLLGGAWARQADANLYIYPQGATGIKARNCATAMICLKNLSIPFYPVSGKLEWLILILANFVIYCKRVQHAMSCT